jgi:hypothetical protein
LSDDLPVQIHGDGNTCDTFNSSIVPIVFVPGVMGSRITMSGAGRSWDPDVVYGAAMLQWLPVTNSGLQTNRRALAPRYSTAKTVRTLGSEGASAIKGNAALGAIFSNATTDGANTATAPLDGTTLSDYSIDQYYGTVRNWASVAWGFYGAFLMWLEAQVNGSLQHPLYVFGYDWRSSNDISGGNLATFIGSVISACQGAQDVIVITHSMGGLVLRGALSASPDVASQIRGVIHGAQPSNGAVVCFRRFFTGCTSQLDGGGRAFSKQWAVSLLLNKIMGDTPAKYAYNMSGIPGALELLPNHVYQSSITDGSQWLAMDGAPDGGLDLSGIHALYRTYSWPGLIGPADAAQSSVATTAELDENRMVNEMTANLGTVERFHRSIETMAHPNTLVAYSDGLGTDVRVQFDAYPADAQSWVQPSVVLNGGATSDGPNIVVYKEASGDGTVPSVSGSCPSLTLARPAQYVSGIDHAAVYSDGGFQEAIITYVNMLLAVQPGSTMGGG